MRLARLSLVSVAACLLGLLALLAVVVHSAQRLEARQQALAELMELSSRVDHFSTASDSLLLQGADPALRAAYFAEARALRRALAGLAEHDPDARKAQYLIERIAERVSAELARTEAAGTPPGAAAGGLAVPDRARILMIHVAGQGIALDTVLNDTLRHRRETIAREATWIGASLAAAALLFASLCVVAFALLHRRVGLPVRRLAQTLERIRAGEQGARAPVAGNDELAELAQTLNRTLDERAAADARLQAQQAALRRSEQLLAMAGHAARFGAWSVDLGSGEIEWSDVVAEIHAMPAGYSPSVEEGIAFYLPEDQPRIRALFSACAEQGTPYDAELRIVDAEGRCRWVRSVGEPVRAADGRILAVQGAFQDISAQKSAEQEAERVQGRLAAMLESITDAFVAMDSEWRYTFANAEAGRLLEASPEELLGTVIWERYPELEDTRIGQALRLAMATRASQSVEEHYQPLGRWFDVRIYPWEEGIAVFFRDVTERRALVERLQQQEASLRGSFQRLSELLDTRRALIDSLPAHIALLDSQGIVVEVNDQWCRFARENAYGDDGFGVGANYLAICEAAEGDWADEAAPVAAGLRAVLSGERQSFALEYPCHAPDRRRWFRVMVNRLAHRDDTAGVADGAVAMHVDITERKRAEEELNRLAFEDRLTGLASRHGFVRALHQRLADAPWEADAALLMLNLRQLRDVNDAHGYGAGDELLQKMARRLQREAGAHGLVGRISADEFAVFLPQGRGALERLGAALAPAFELRGGRVEMSCRFGYTLLGPLRRTAETLLREAALALSECRDDDFGDDGWVAYSGELARGARRRMEITADLREALRRDEFELHFQPKVRLATGELIACEALLRWHHPERGLQSPGSFIPVAERSQLIAPIGDWVVGEACRALRRWQDEHLQLVQMSVNVSLVQLTVGDFPATVRRALAESGVRPASLTLEITESVFARESERLRGQLQELHELGVRLSLDDFGTGYSSLLYLQQYPFDEIKIDQRFVRRMTTDSYSRNIVRTVLGIGEALGAEVIAEGIETPAMRDALLEMGCQLGQGFYYSMPLAAEDFRWLLEARSALPVAATSQPRGSRQP